MDDMLVQLKEDIFNILWQTPVFETAVYTALEHIGHRLSADSVYVAELSADAAAVQHVYLWERDTAEEHAGELERLAGQQYRDGVRALTVGREAAFWCADDAPENSAEGVVRSVLLSQIADKGEFFGYFGLADFRTRRGEWAEGDVQDVVAALSKIIGVFLLKDRYTKHSVETQRRLETSLRASERRADTAYELLDAISAGVIIVNLYPDGRALPQYGNLGMYRMLRIPRTAEDAVVPDRSVAVLEGEYFEDFFANIPEPDNGRVRGEYKAGFHTDHFTVKKYRLLCGDGTYVWVSADLSLRETTPDYRTYYVTYTDMSEEQSLQAGLVDMLSKEKEITAKLEKASRAKSDFLSHMSHDIRTPMNAIIGMTSIARSHIDDPDRVLDCLEKISVSSKLLLSIINEVLDMSKVESGRLVLAEEEVDLAELVQGVVTMVQPQIGEKDLQFEARINDVPHETVISDMQRLQQLLVNLLSNAVKYTPEGGEVLLEIYEKPSDLEGHACYEFVVSDTGIGMSPEFMERVFEPFERAEDERIKAVQGTGLGLSICKTVAEMMGGRIQVESEWGKGSVFTVVLYLRIRQEPLDDRTLEGLPVLVVDNDEIICRNASKRLAGLGMKPEWVLEGSAAVEKVAEAHRAGADYFAVIVDLKMPGMDGMQTTRLIRERVGAALPIIMISAYDLTERMELAREAGADGFITKPLFRSRLAYKLKQFLEGGTYSAPASKVSRSCLYSGRRLLLAEDNELNREIAVELLSESGVEVDTAENGKIALEKVAASPEGYYHLIFMDMQMPVMDGCAAAAAIRALDRADAKTLPIVAMTANAFADDRQRTRDAGMNEHMAKPIDMDQLNQVLHRFLSR